MDKVKIALIGTGNRGTSVYLPIISALKDDLQLVAVCDAREESVQQWGAKYNVPAYADLEKMVKEQKPEVAAVVITPSNNHLIGIPLAQLGVSYVTETPIDTSLEWADKMIQAAKENNTKIEVAENYYRVPMERLKRAMILAGVFGKILTAYNDFRGHGYHGVGLIRSYVGFEVEAKRVIGMSKSFKVQMHTFRKGQPPKDDENWQHGIIEFENGSVGVFNFTSLSYGSPLRWHNSSKFYGERGMCVGEEAAILNETADARRPIKITRRTTQADGMEVLDALVADTESEIVWENPFRKYPLSEGQISVASELMSIANAVRHNTDPEYGPINGRKDREIDLAISKSWGSGSAPVELPL